MPMAYLNSKSHLEKYKQGLNDSGIVFNVNVPRELIDLILSYVDQSKVPRLHIMNSTHYIQINMNYLIDQYWNSILK